MEQAAIAGVNCSCLGYVGKNTKSTYCGSEGYKGNKEEIWEVSRRPDDFPGVNEL